MIRFLFALVIVLVLMLTFYLFWVVVKLTKLENKIEVLELDNRKIKNKYLKK